MDSTLDGHVAALLRASSVGVREALRSLTRPLRPYWIVASSADDHDVAAFDHDCRYACIVCVSCSRYDDDDDAGPVRRERVPRRFAGRSDNGSDDEERYYYYSPGAADDEESWARGLTPRSFWEHVDEILSPDDDDADSDETTVRAVDQVVARLRASERTFDAVAERASDLSSAAPATTTDHASCLYHAIGDTGLFVGSRRAGRPPECWERFDAILNVSELEYENVVSVTETLRDPERSRRYLRLPVREGKRDRNELERLLALGLVFLLINATEGRRVLVHCAQGRDRSVAVVVAALALFWRTNDDDESPTRREPWRNGVNGNIWESLRTFSTTTTNDDAASSPRDNVDDLDLRRSGMDHHLARGLLGREGRDALLAWTQSVCSKRDDKDVVPLVVTKETLVRCLQVVQTYRSEAHPSRKTMQKLNRFFMSGEHER